ncbi:hypothetical protein TNCV_4924951 [Trichonephila clavipes]|nr:hypothetical protein TNCV_4924951 [Trichonephila clavipes]
MHALAIEQHCTVGPWIGRLVEIHLDCFGYLQQQKRFWQPDSFWSQQVSPHRTLHCTPKRFTPPYPSVATHLPY